MISRYGLFYTFSKVDDILEVVFSDKEITSSKRENDVELFYNGNDIVKANIYGIKKYVKIRINGLIYLPSEEFISLVNSYLGPYDVMISMKENSGYFIGKYNEKYVIYAEKDTILSDKTFAKERKICTFKDLSISDSDSELVIEEGLKDEDIGKDFFAMEAHENVGN